MRTIQEFRESTAPAVVRAWGAVRRFVITMTETAIWQVTGVRLPDGIETRRAEVFGGIGLVARPPAGVEAEAIGAMVGDANAPVIVAVRDEATRSAKMGDIAEDETAIFNGQARVHVRADGTIEARTHGGTAKQLVTIDDYNALRDWIHTTMIVNATGATAGTTTPPPNAMGTQKLRGE